MAAAHRVISSVRYACVRGQAWCNAFRRTLNPRLADREIPRKHADCPEVVKHR